MTDEAITAVAGLVASFLSGLLGIGGGLVLTPFLLYLPPLVGGVAIPVKIVTGLTIVQAISGSALGTLRHRSYGNVSSRLVWLMGPPSAIAAVVGAFLSRDLADNVILIIFAILAFAGSIMLLLPVTPRDEPAEDIRADPRLAIPIALVLGFFGGIVGIGGIAFIIAALVYILRVPPRIAIGSSLGIGRFVVLVPEDEATRARAVLHESAGEEPHDNPVVRLIVIVALMTGLLLATPFVARACFGAS